MRTRTKLSLARTVRTLVRLRPDQVFWRLRYRLEGKLHRRRRLPGSPSVLVRDERVDRLSRLLPELVWLRRDPGYLAELPALLRGGTFRFLNDERQLGFAPTDWRLGDPSTNRLWVMTLHTHPWVYELALAAANDPDGAAAENPGIAHTLRVLVDDWMDSCALHRPGSSALAWNSYTIATRLRWWVAAIAVAYDQLLSDADFASRMLGSAASQAAFLDRHIEWDLRGNHLIRDAEGLAWAGALFDGPSAARWRSSASALACDQANRQILADGGHFERSGRYHLQVMRDLATIAILSDDASTTRNLAGVWKRMAELLPLICHPDGCTHQLNDSSLDAALDAAFIDATADLLGVRPELATPRGGVLLRQSGLAIWHGEPWTVFVDVGEVGAAEQPGHAHADSLTLECSLDGKRLFVDPGTYAYDLDERRGYDRSTTAHNTICVDGVDSSEIWHIFRLGRRATTTVREFETSSTGMRVRAEHDGYRHMRGSPCHERTVAVGHERLNIRDVVQGRGRHRVNGGFLLAPSWRAELRSDGWRLSEAASGRRLDVRLRSSGPVEPAVRTRPYHPKLGTEIQTDRIEWSWEGDLPCLFEVTIDLGQS